MLSPFFRRPYIVMPCFYKRWPLLFLGMLLCPINGYNHSDKFYYLIFDHWTKFTHLERHCILCFIHPLLHSIHGQLSLILTNPDYIPGLPSPISPSAINQILEAKRRLLLIGGSAAHLLRFPPTPTLFKSKGMFLDFSIIFQSLLLCSNLAPIYTMLSSSMIQ